MEQGLIVNCDLHNPLATIAQNTSTLHNAKRPCHRFSDGRVF
jgi:hypothetical protein